MKDPSLANQKAESTHAISPQRHLSDLQVHFISLVESAANGRTFLAKQAENTDLEVIEKQILIVKTDKTKKMVYGIVYAPDETDSQGDMMSSAEIEKAAYDFMRARRTRSVDTDHSFEEGAGFVAESWLVKEEDTLFAGEPEGAWAVGIKVLDEEVWQRVVKGELKGLSLAGLARVAETRGCGDAETRRDDGRRTTDDGRIVTGDIEGEDVAGTFVRRVKALFGLEKALKEPRLEDFDERRDIDGRRTTGFLISERVESIRWYGGLNAEIDYSIHKQNNSP